MTRHFCTLFDSNYLFKALAMYRSLERHARDFHLHAFCFDDEAKRIVDALALEHVTTVSLDELERYDADLRATKDDRTPTEYCWTATPVLPHFVLHHRPEIADVTYLDADLMFFADPEPLFDEMGDKSVLITPHRFAPEHEHQARNGIFNVQFMVFNNDAPGTHVLEWWRDRCIEWCYYRHEGDRFGDQKYLDDWPERFEAVHVLQHKGGGLAPWNISQYSVDARDRRVMVDEDPLVFFHYHRVRLQSRGRHRWQPPGYPITRRQMQLVYRPYLAALDQAIREVRAVDPKFSAGLETPPTARERASHLRHNVVAHLRVHAPWLWRVRDAVTPRAGR